MNRKALAEAQAVLGAVTELLLLLVFILLVAKAGLPKIQNSGRFCYLGMGTV